MSAPEYTAAVTEAAAVLEEAARTASPVPRCVRLRGRRARWPRTGW